MVMADPLPISVAIVCKDSARTIEAVLASVSGWVAEIVAVDSGSTDGTIETLERYGARVIRSDWLGHVKTKQKALEACAQAWVLCLDSDEPVEQDLRQSIESFVRADGRGADGAMVNRKIWYAGRFLDHAWQPEWRLRLVRARKAAWGGHDPHDKLELTGGGEVEKLAGTLRHESFVTFADQFAKDSGYARMMAANLHAAGARGSRLRCVTSPIGAFAKQMLVKQAWRDGRAGWLAALATASATLQKHAMLLELSLKDGERG
ncbi:MAG: putative glycosyltransferase [Phycisphaeraceae bacterium]|nr:MAG: putative glycosyltransferase [Phycisphaeraceae bacterium]